jgi:hypothetical protein
MKLSLAVNQYVARKRMDTRSGTENPAWPGSASRPVISMSLI